MCEPRLCWPDTKQQRLDNTIVKVRQFYCLWIEHMKLLNNKTFNVFSRQGLGVLKICLCTTTFVFHKSNKTLHGCVVPLETWFRRVNMIWRKVSISPISCCVCVDMHFWLQWRVCWHNCGFLYIESVFAGWLSCTFACGEQHMKQTAHSNSSLSPEATVNHILCLPHTHTHIAEKHCVCLIMSSSDNTYSSDFPRLTRLTCESWHEAVKEGQAASLAK